MSGITGIFRRDGKDVDPADIKKMNDKIAHRGPDGSRVWCEGPVAFGHQMLHTTQESLHETLPFEDEESGLVITADARIDNRKDLAPLLGIEDNEYVSDSYFILKAYEKWGEKCPEELLGDFAFAIWDKNKEHLFCARDHMGIKQFYFYISDNVFCFATEIKSIFCLRDIPILLNEKKLALFLMRDIMDNELTFYEDIFNLPASHCLTANKYIMAKEKYWELDPNLEIIMDSEEEYVKAFREVFAEAVSCRLRSNFPIGFELSGGIDSSSIVCMARELLQKNHNEIQINTYSNIYDEIPESDERNYIEKISYKNNIKSNFLKGDNTSPLDNIKQVLLNQDQPFFSPHLTNQLKLYKKAHNDGIRILFTGEGGDEIISHGGNYVRELFCQLKLKKFFDENKGESKKLKQSRLNNFISNIVLPSIPYFIKKWIRFIRGDNTTFFLNENLLKKIEIEKIDYYNIFDHLSKVSTKEYHYLTINTTTLSQTIFGIIDRSTASLDIEERYPFFDKRVVEFCYALPTEMKLKNGWDRYILRIAMENILPIEIQWRLQKANLGAVYKRNLMLFEKNTIEKAIYNDIVIMSAYVDLEEIQDIYAKFNSGKVQNLFDIWLVIITYVWLKNKKFDYN